MQLGWHVLPNVLTLLRFILILPFALALYQGQYLLALVFFALAAISDGADGFLARRFGWFSRFGAIADPLADKALLVTSYAVLTLTGVVPGWLFAVIVLRDLAIVSGGLAYHLLFGPFQIAPTWLGKLNTFIQILFVVSVMAGYAGLPMPDAIVPVGVAVVAVSAIVSGLHYVFVWSLRAWRGGEQ